MNRLAYVAITAGVLPSVFALGRVSAYALPTAATNPGWVMEHDSLVAVRQPGPHRGGGETTAYSFFAKVSGMPLVFRKRALHPGSAIGYHEQKEDEVYYVLSGSGELMLDSTRHVIGPGTAVLTRPGTSHSLRQIGEGDLVILIAYPAEND